MKLKKWALIAEIVGGIAIVLSLAFVGYEIRLNNQRQVQSTTQSIVSDYSVYVSLIAEDAALACIYVRGGQDYLGMTGADRVRFSALWISILRVVEDMYYQEKAGYVDSRIWSGIDATMRESMQLPGMQQWFAQRGDWFSAEFREFLSGMIGDPTAGPALDWEDPQCHTRGSTE